MSPSAKRTDRIYQDFATIYDEVMANQFANLWLKSFKLLRQRFKLSYRSLADIGCGTGSITTKLASAHRSLFLIDQSAAMLAQAKQRCPQATLLQSDMLAFQLPQQVDLIIATYGIVHYLNGWHDLLRFFKKVKQHLNHSAYFCFDYFTEKHIKTNFGGGTEVFEGEDYLSIWHHRWNDQRKQADIIIEGFKKYGRCWKRHQPEWHGQQAFTWPEIQGALRQAGFYHFHHFALPDLQPARRADLKRIVLVQNSAPSA